MAMAARLLEGTFLRYAVALAVASGIWILLTREHFEEMETARHILEERGHTVVDALVAGLRAQTRMGRYRADRLDAIFDEVATMDHVRGIGLFDAAGNWVAGADSLSPQGPQTEWHADGLTVRGAFTMGGPEDHNPRGFGRGRWEEEGLEPWGSSEYRVVLLLDDADTRAAIRRAWRELGVGCGAVLVVMVLILGALRARDRQRRLHADLDRARLRAAHHERLAQLGAGLAHETKNPLGLVRGLAQSIADEGDAGAESRACARQIVDETDRVVGQLNAFLGFAHPRTPDLSNVTLQPLFAELQALAAPESAQAGVNLAIEARNLSIVADPGMLRRALLNLLINGVRACRPGGGQVRLEAERQGKLVNLKVCDTGRGIAPEDLDRVTEPYFTRYEGGTGLGLAIVQQIAEVHEWRLRIESAPGRGTTVVLEGITPGEPVS